MNDPAIAFDNLKRAATHPPSQEDAIDAALVDVSACINELARERDRYRAALQIIADRVYPATYLGEAKDGTKMYGGSQDASDFARRVLEGGDVT